VGRTLAASHDPLATISAEFERGIEVLAAQQPILGCPLNNLAQEMNPLDAGFRDRTTRVFDTWREADRSGLARAQQRGTVLAAIDPGDTAHMLVAQIEGTLSLARNTQDPQTLTTGARALRSYLALDPRPRPLTLGAIPDDRPDARRPDRTRRQARRTRPQTPGISTLILGTSGIFQACHSTLQADAE
jgi:hypothetical protein